MESDTYLFPFILVFKVIAIVSTTNLDQSKEDLNTLESTGQKKANVKMY